MVPRKVKEITEVTSNILNVSESLVDDVIQHFYKEVRIKMSSLDEPVLKIQNLGTFKIKRKRLLKAMVKYKKRSNNIEVADSFIKFTVKKEADDRLVKYEKLLEYLLEEDGRKQAVKDRRNGNNNNNLEK